MCLSSLSRKVLCTCLIRSPYFKLMVGSMTISLPPIAIRHVWWRAWSTAHPAGSVAGVKRLAAAIWEAGARDGSGETLDMLDIVLCVLAAPDRAAAPWPTRSRTVRARAKDPSRRGRNRVGADRAEAGVGENFVVG
jgi:hypothetical protein